MEQRWKAEENDIAVMRKEAAVLRKEAAAEREELEVMSFQQTGRQGEDMDEETQRRSSSNHVTEEPPVDQEKGAARSVPKLGTAYADVEQERREDGSQEGAGT